MIAVVVLVLVVPFLAPVVLWLAEQGHHDS